jgi:hypothetical protein
VLDLSWTHLNLTQPCSPLMLRRLPAFRFAPIECPLRNHTTTKRESWCGIPILWATLSPSLGHQSRTDSGPLVTSRLQRGGIFPSITGIWLLANNRRLVKCRKGKIAVTISISFHISGLVSEIYVSTTRRIHYPVDRRYEGLITRDWLPFSNSITWRYSQKKWCTGVWSLLWFGDYEQTVAVCNATFSNPVWIK